MHLSSCPSGNEKWALVTSHKKNNKPYVDAFRSKQTEVNNIKKHAVKQNTQKTDNTMLPFTGRVSYTDASGSKPRSNTRNDKIPRPSCRSKKNKVNVQPRKSKSSSNKNNHILDFNANIKNVALSKNYANVCLSCNECLFSENHDACVVKYLKVVQKRKKAKSVTQKEKIQRKTTGRIFTSIGLRWKPTRRMFNMEGKICPIIKTSLTTIVPSRNRLHTISFPTVAPSAKTRMRCSIAKNSLIRAHINSYGHPFNPPNFSFVRNPAIPKQSS
ncbi:hypothetical protein Tco_1562111 [Tanacetum coccineum]